MTDNLEQAHIAWENTNFVCLAFNLGFACVRQHNDYTQQQINSLL